MRQDTYDKSRWRKIDLVLIYSSLVLPWQPATAMHTTRRVLSTDTSESPSKKCLQFVLARISITDQQPLFRSGIIFGTAGWNVF